METVAEDADLPEGWIKCYSKSIKGKLYYFNTLTGESLWEHPEAILYNDQGTEKQTPIKTEDRNASESCANFTEYVPVAEDKLKSGNIGKPAKEAELANGREFTSERKWTTGSSLACESISLSGKKVNEAELKLKPIARISKKSKMPLLGKESKGAKIKKNTNTRNVVNLNSAFNVLNKNPGSVGNGYTDKPLSGHMTNRLPNGNETSLKKSRDLGEDANSKKMLHRKVGNRSFVIHSSTEAVDNKGSLGLKNEAKGKSWVKSRNVEEDEKFKNRNPLKPLKHHRLDHLNSKTDGVWNYKAAGNSTSVDDAVTNGKPNINIVPRKIAPPEQQTRENTTIYSQGTIRSRGTLSDRSSSLDMGVHGAMETEAVDERLEGSWCTHGESLEEAMEIDDVEFMSKRILKQIENIRMERIEIPEMDYDHTAPSEVGLEGTNLFIVLDTNILLSHLKFVRELMDSPIPGAGRPTVIIPWMVTQELDRLKSAPDSRVHEFEDDDKKPVVSVNVLARRAIGLLSECFSENHPRLKGQTAYEARQPIDGLVQETNDDNILHCCLLVKAKAPQAKTVLLSRDRNLCNKAIVNGVKAFDNKKLINGLRDLFQSGNIIVHKDHYKEYFKVAENQEFLAERRKKADDLVCELQCILREAFTVIVEKEMKEAYDDLWSTVVKIKPPWTLSDALDLLEKHWIAVFGHVVHRTLKPSIQELRAKFFSGDATLRDLDSAGKLIDLGHHICDAFAVHSDYNGVMPKCLAALIVLQRSYSQYSANLTLLRHADQNKQPLSLQSTPLDISDDKLIPECVNRVLHNSPGTAENNNAQASPQRHPHFTVMRSFDEIWKAVRVLSSSVFHSLEYPNPYEDEGSVMPQRSSREETFRFLNQFIPCLERLVQAIQRVVACPVESSMENTAVFVNLGESIAHFMKEMMCQDCSITLFGLRDFCIDNQCRTALIQGLSQLDRALAMLQHCASFASSRP